MVCWARRAEKDFWTQRWSTHLYFYIYLFVNLFHNPENPVHNMKNEKISCKNQFIFAVMLVSLLFNFLISFLNTSLVFGNCLVLSSVFGGLTTRKEKKKEKKKEKDKEKNVTRPTHI